MYLDRWKEMRSNEWLYTGISVLYVISICKICAYRRRAYLFMLITSWRDTCVKEIFLGLSHVAFGALAIATVLKIANVNIFIMPVTIVCAILLLRTGTNTKLKGDAAIAMLSVGSMAVGYLILNVFSVSSNVSGDVCSTLFGSTSILTLTGSEVIMCVIASLVVVAFFIIFYNRIFSVTFDENFTRSMGKNTNVYNLMIAVITAVIIVLAMNLVGSLLITALLVFPALSAMRVMTSFKSVIIYSAILSVFGAVFGIIISIFTSTPVGSTIVTIYILIFIINCIIGRILRI